MDFALALRAMRTGKRVGRRCRAFEVALFEDAFRIRVPGFEWRDYVVPTCDLLADDWRVVGGAESFRPSSEDLTAARARIAADRMEDLTRRVEALEVRALGR